MEGTMTTLLASIGVQDPESNEGPTGPLRMVIERPTAIQRVYLFATEPVRQQADRTVERIEERGVPATRIDIADVDPVDVGALQRWFQRTLLDLEIPGPIYVCATSGTPQITTALTTVCSYLYPAAEHWQALNPKFAEPGRPLTRPFDPDLLRHLDQTAQALEHLERIETISAQLLFAARAKSSLQRESAQYPFYAYGEAVCAALNAADELAPDRAFKVMDAQARWLPYRTNLRAWYSTLRRLDGQKPEWPVELLASAERYMARGVRSAALMRVATAYEVGLTLRLRQHPAFPFNPRKMTERQAQRLEELAREAGAERVGGLVNRRGGGRITLDGAERLATAVALLDKIPLEHGRLGGVHEKMIDARNDLAHSGRHPEPQTVEASIAFVRDRFTTWGWPVKNCPTRPDAIREVARRIARDLRWRAAT
jgi:hypothetical protein